MHPAPKRALFLGVGTGITLHAANFHPDLEVDGVELVPEVVDVIPQFVSLAPVSPDHGRIRLYTADARRFVRSTPNAYDVIVADLFHPGRDGGGMLYTREHFRAVSERLSPGGLFCQWLPLYQLDEPMIRVIIKSFLEVYPNARALLMNNRVKFPALALVGTYDAVSPSYSADWFDARVSDDTLRSNLRSVGLESSYHLFGAFVASADALMDYAGEAVINTDE